MGLPEPGFEPGTPALASRFFTTEPPGKSIQNSIGARVFGGGWVGGHKIPERLPGRADS